MPLIATRANASVFGYGFQRQSLPYLWVAVGASGNLWTSSDTDGATWTSRTSSFSTTQINGVASDGRNLYVAVGNAGKLATSPDGVTWTQRTSSFGATNINAVVWGGQWVAVGDDGKIATSSDGVTWTQQTSGTSDALSVVEWGDGLFFAASKTTSTALTATDPTSTWTSRTTTLGDHLAVHYWKAKGVWIAGHDSGATNSMASSTDGITWTARNHSSSSLGTNDPMMIASLPSVAVAVHNDEGLPAAQSVASTTNGTSWTTRSFPDLFGTNKLVASDTLGNFVTVSQGNVFHSTDGVTWTDVTSTKPTVELLFMCHSSGLPAIR